VAHRVGFTINWTIALFAERALELECRKLLFGTSQLVTSDVNVSFCTRLLGIFRPHACSDFGLCISEKRTENRGATAF